MPTCPSLSTIKGLSQGSPPGWHPRVAPASLYLFGDSFIVFWGLDEKALVSTYHNLVLIPTQLCWPRPAVEPEPPQTAPAQT